jgi:hypothetical protein
MKRRALLAIGATATAAIAGCSAISSSDGDGDSGSGSYGPVARWAVPADEDSGMPAYGIGSYAPADTISEIDHVTEETILDVIPGQGPNSPTRASWIWDQVDARSLELAVNVRSSVRQPSRNYWIYEGEFGADDVASGLDTQHSAASEVGTHEGYTIYEATSDTGTVGRLYAIADGTAIEYRSIYSHTPIPDAIEAVVDAGVGESKTLLDQYEAANSLARELSPNLQSGLGIAPSDPEPDPEAGLFGGLAASGDSVRAAGDRIEHVYGHAFRNESALDDAAIDEWIAAYEDDAPVESTTTATSGRVHVTRFDLPVEVVFPRPRTADGA